MSITLTEDKTCRICLESVEAMFNLFEDPTTTFKLELCCGIRIMNIPTLPSKICKKCSDILNVAYDFRVLCQRSQEYLSDQPLTQEDDCKPNLAEIDLDTFGVFDEDEEPLEIEPSETDNIEQNENSTEIEQYNDCKPDIVDSDEPESRNTGGKQFGHKAFKGRGPRKLKSTVSLMCNICGNLYQNKATFNYHMKLHRKDKKYECEICKKLFMQTCELQAHIRIHTGEKPFKCTFCDRKFRDRSGVTRHERTHTNERPFACDICGANFSYSATLKKHERVHTGEKPFKCMICSKQFSESHQLKAHLATIRHRDTAREQSKLIVLL